MHADPCELHAAQIAPSGLSNTGLPLTTRIAIHLPELHGMMPAAMMVVLKMVCLLSDPLSGVQAS